MPLKVNGHTISWGFVSSAVVAIFWLSGLSFQVAANGDQLATHVPSAMADKVEIKERLASIEAYQVSAKEDIKEIKDEQKSQADKLDKILEKVSESR